MDPETAKMAIQLQLADIDDLLDGLYDDEDLPTGDARSGFELMRQDLQKQLQVLTGQVLSLNILREEHNNRLAFSRLLKEEKQASGDHQLARRLANLKSDNVDINRGAESTTSACVDWNPDADLQWGVAKEIYATALKCKVSDRAPLNGIRTIKSGDGQANTQSRILGSEALVKCNACMEAVRKEDALTLKCEPEAHTYCRDCLVDLFTSAITDSSLFPPKCCKLPVPLEICRALLPKGLIKDFDLKVEELATPNPIYCSNAACAQFIRPNNVRADIGDCVFCEEKTCVRCKCTQHTGLCPSDPHVQLLMDVAKRGRWQQCTKCKNMIELAQGCFHMT